MSPLLHRWTTRVWWAVLGLFPCGNAQAQIPLGPLTEAVQQLDDDGRRFIQTYGVRSDDGQPQGSAPLPLLLRLDPDRDPPETARRLVGQLFYVSAPRDQWDQLQALGKLSLSGVRHPNMSVAGPRVRAPDVTKDYGLEGTGSIIGVLDTGADVAHPSLRNEDGTSRVLWLLTYGRKPTGKHPELEEEYGCSNDEPCAIYDQAEIDALLASGDESELPDDEIGHGTHITSIAAGRDEDYPGIAPDADLIIVGASDESGGVYDSRILTGTRFVFDRARERNQPAVINISLGSNFGSHRGDSELEVGLNEFASGPGRAIVVAAGNSGDRYRGILPAEFANFGPHGEYAVTPAADVRIPVLQYPLRQPQRLRGAIYLWIASYPGQQLDAAVVTSDDNTLTPWVQPGQAAAVSSSRWNDPDSFDIIILNGTADSSDLDVPPENIVIAVVGSFRSDRSFEVLLRGQGTARVWASGTGAAAYGQSGLGPLLPRAQTLGTVQVPATRRELVSVGATTNREEWTDADGNDVGSGASGTGLASFSSKGPNQLGDLKPELVAPGDGVIAAMAAAADPRGLPYSRSQFNAQGSCPSGDACYVIDDLHGIGSGTSMAAPIVTGAIALLMQRDSELTMDRAKRFLMAGARPVGNSERADGWGAGEVDIYAALLAQDAETTRPSSLDRAPRVDLGLSYVVWADELVHPSPAPALQGLLLLRDGSGAPRPVAEEDVHIEVNGPGSGSIDEAGPGLFDIRLGADRKSAGEMLDVRIQVGEETLARQRIPIDLDPVRVETGYGLAGGTCSLDSVGPRSPSMGWMLTWAVTFGCWIRRRRALRIRC